MSLLCSTATVVSGCNGKVLLACPCPIRNPEVQPAVVFEYTTFPQPYTLHSVNSCTNTKLGFMQKDLSV